MRIIELTTDSIKLGQFLKLIGFVMTGGECKCFLENKCVKVNDLIQKSRGKQLFDGDLIEIDGKKFVIKSKNDLERTKNL